MASLYPKGRYIGLEEAGKIIEGTIEGFHRSTYSELAHIIIDGRAILFMNHLLVQALHDYFGNFIVKGRNCDENAIIGKRIMFSTDDKGVLDKLYSVDGTANELN